ncbi:LA_2272/LA_2273 family lipoprotein [Leptospira interrogans]|uniref:LA_2272/LA_2273 family lipoprotein n=1 Tax=Leptospira interrogans TaxID=173 RepID=UPI000A5914A0
MKINFKHTTNAFLILYVIPMLNCGVALTSEKTIKIPPKTQTEVFRLNLIHGNVENLYGLNVGIFNSVNNSMIGAQVGIVNLSDKNTYGWQFAIINMAEKKGLFKIQTGIANLLTGTQKNSAGLQVGIFNLGTNIFPDIKLNERRGGFYLTIGVGNYETNGLMIGAINLSSKGINVAVINKNTEGFNLGIINLQEGSAFSIGAVNIGSSRDVGFQIGIINYCPNNTIPIMLVANYCSSPSPQSE